MNKKTLIITIIILIVITGGVLFSLTRGPETQPYQIKVPVIQKEALIIEQNLMPIKLSQEEQQALRDEGIEPLSDEEDRQAKDLQSVRSSDELDAIEADLNETDLSELDAELETIENDLSGL